MSFTYTKEMMFAEFKTATIKDNKDKKEKFDNRINFINEMILLKKESPKAMRTINIKAKQFDNLLFAWKAPNPRDHFYQKVFNRTYAEQKAFEAKQYSGEKEGK